MTFGHDPIDLPLLVDGPCKENPPRMEAVEWSFTRQDKSTLPRVVITSTFYYAWFQLIIHHGTLYSLTTNGTEILHPG